MKRFIIYIPFLMLLGDGMSFLMYHTEIYDDYLFLHSEVFGHSLLPVIFMLYFAKRLKYCAFSVVAIISLGVLNTLNLLYFFVDLLYYELYVGLIIFVGITFAVISWLRTHC